MGFYLVFKKADNEVSFVAAKYFSNKYRGFKNS